MAAPTSQGPDLFQGSFHFVNFDVTNMKTLPHRRAVFTHVQNNYRTWKSRERTKRLYEPAKVPRASIANVHEDITDAVSLVLMVKNDQWLTKASKTFTSSRTARHRRKGPFLFPRRPSASCHLSRNMKWPSTANVGFLVVLQ